MPFPKIGQAIVASAVILALLGSHSWAQSAPDPQGLDNTKWTAIGINGGVLSAEKHPELAFETGGGFGGSGGCNRFTGQAEMSGNSLSFPDNMAATLMACPPAMEKVEDQFLDALQRVTTYAVAGDSLVLLDASGEPVLKFMRSN